MLEPQVYRIGATPAMQQQPPVMEEPTIEVEEASEGYARIVASPLLPGFGITLGNAIRRVLLSSLRGAAVTSVRIDGVQHEFERAVGLPAELRTKSEQHCPAPSIVHFDQRALAGDRLLAREPAAGE